MPQVAKKLESSKATACHIKQVAGDPQAAQINLLRHQHTELPAGKYKKKRPPGSPNKQTKSTRAVMVTNCKHNTRRDSIPRVCTMTESDAPNAVTHSTLRGSNALPKSTNVRPAISLAISQACATRRSKHTPS